MTSFGIHLHSAPGDITVSTLMLWLQLMGGTAARLDTSWSDYQAPPQPKSFNPRAAHFTEKKYADYLLRRGYGSDGANLSRPVQGLMDAAAAHLRGIFNFGVIRDWAYAPRSNFPQGSAGDRKWGLSLADPAYVGEFLHDFIVYTSRMEGGFAALEKLGGWQIFNEVGGIYGERDDQLPRRDYFEIGEHTLSLVQKAYDAVEWEKHSKAPRPAVILPSLAGTHNPLFFDNLFDYRPEDKSTVNANGQLAIQAITLHPYGQRIEPWLDPLTDESLGDATKSNLSYHRIVRPTDDLLSWHALVNRDVKLSQAYGLSLYATAANPADAYFNRNTETGMEQAMAQLQQNGFGDVKVHLTEWGLSTWPGDPASDSQSLWNSAFADPYKYGYVAPGSVLPNALAENVQAETVMQLVGLAESWSFVDTASIYEFFDQAPGEYEGEFGLARAALRPDGKPDWKPAGRVYQAYLTGEAFSLTDMMATGVGVAIHLAAAGLSGRFDNSARDAAAHELLLLRQGDDTMDGEGGDDVVFGGEGSDRLMGGGGYDRLYGGNGNDVLNGGSGADKLKGDSGDDTLTGGEGFDHFAFAAFGPTGSGFAGHDTITDFDPRSERLLLVGSYRAADLLDKKLYPGLVRDEAGGTRIVYADNGASIVLSGVSRADLSVGNFHILQSDRTVKPKLGDADTNGSVEKFGQAGPDILQSGVGNDLLDGGSGADRLDGGAGNDTYVVDSHGDEVVEERQGGLDRIVSRVSIAKLASHVEVLLLDSSKPIDGAGNELDNEISGNPNRNVLRGGTGNDLLLGGAGRDTLSGDAGDDTLTGGSGNDLFVAGDGVDTITDFTHGDVVKTTLDQPLSAAQQVDADVEFNLGKGSKLVLKNVQLEQLKPEDFQPL